MPNWCWNNLQINGSKKDMAKFYKALNVLPKSEMSQDDLDGEDQRLFDFNDFVPRPKSLDITSGSCTDRAVACIKYAEGQKDVLDEKLGWPAWVKETDIKETDSLDVKRDKMYKSMVKDVTKEHLKEGRQYMDNIEKYGHGTWYNWSYDNWGTKWNACDVYIHEKQEDYFHVGFSTAWSPPVPVIEALMEQHPNLDVELEYSESGMGFAGTLGRQGGITFDNEGEIINLSHCCREEMTDEWYEDCDEKELYAWEICPKCKGECEFNEEIIYKQ